MPQPTLKDFSNLNIDWKLTPEQAVTLYLEWGNNDWRSEHPPVRSKTDVAYYFVVDNWGPEPVIRLVERNSENARDLITIPVPPHLLAQLKQDLAGLRGISTPTPALKEWLNKEME